MQSSAGGQVTLIRFVGSPGASRHGRMMTGLPGVDAVHAAPGRRPSDRSPPSPRMQDNDQTLILSDLNGKNAGLLELVGLSTRRKATPTLV